MSIQPFNWKRFHAYRVFDEFLERFIIQRRSYVTKHQEQLNFEAALNDIQKRFIAAFDASDSRFEEKIARQFKDAPTQTKIVFANVEYLWAMPMENITPRKKRSYALRWFDESEVVSGGGYFFGTPHIIANPGPWYLRNKYWEIVAALRVLSIVAKRSGSTDFSTIKKQIAKICHDALYAGVPEGERFAVPNFCGIHPALMHLADPERYESIISDSHRNRIIAVFGHVLANPSSDGEERLKQIRATLYDSHGLSEDPDNKYRWFFYSKGVVSLWIDKKSPKEQRVSSAVLDVRAEEDAVELEGGKEEVKGYRIRRSSKTAEAAKIRDGYTCQACSFHFENQIVHVHHLDPLSEYLHPKATKPEDLVTLCPTCHYLAHYWLRKSDKFKQLALLLPKLKSVTPAR